MGTELNNISVGPMCRVFQKTPHCLYSAFCLSIDLWEVRTTGHMVETIFFANSANSREESVFLELHVEKTLSSELK